MKTKVSLITILPSASWKWLFLLEMENNQHTFCQRLFLQVKFWPLPNYIYVIRQVCNIFQKHCGNYIYIIYLTTTIKALFYWSTIQVALVFVGQRAGSVYGCDFFKSETLGKWHMVCFGGFKTPENTLPQGILRIVSAKTHKLCNCSKIPLHAMLSNY